MTKAIASYPKSMRPTVVARRMRSYDPKGSNGMGTLAARDYYVKHPGATTTKVKVKSESPSDVRRRAKRAKNA